MFLVLIVYILFMLNLMVRFILKQYCSQKSYSIKVMWDLPTVIEYPSYPSLDSLPKYNTHGEIVYIEDVHLFYIYDTCRQTYAQLHSTYTDSLLTYNKPKITKYLISELGIFIDIYS